MSPEQDQMLMDAMGCTIGRPPWERANIMRRAVNGILANQAIGSNRMIEDYREVIRKMAVKPELRLLEKAA